MNIETNVLSNKTILYTKKSKEREQVIIYNNKYKNKVLYDNPNRLELIGCYFLGQKIIISALELSGDYYIFNPKTSTLRLESLKAKRNDYDLFWILDCTDKYILYADEKQLLVDYLDNTKEIDTIKISGTKYGRISCSSKDIIAIQYTSSLSDSNKNTFFDSFPLTLTPQDFVLFDLNNKKKIRTNYKPAIISNWSPDGKNLICIDSSSVKLLQYPSLNLKELKYFDHTKIKFVNLIFLDNSSIAFQGKFSSDSTFQIYIYDIINDRITSKITNDDYPKHLYDVYNQ